MEGASPGGESGRGVLSVAHAWDGSVLEEDHDGGLGESGGV